MHPFNLASWLSLPITSELVTETGHVSWCLPLTFKQCWKLIMFVGIPSNYSQQCVALDGHWIARDFFYDSCYFMFCFYFLHFWFLVWDGLLWAFSCLPQIAGMVSEHLIIIFSSLSSDNFYSWVNFNCKYWEALNSYADISLIGTIL